MSKFYKTTITIEVLSEGPIHNYGLGEIIENSISGDFSMALEKRKSIELTKSQLKEECSKHGTDPAFFLQDE